MALDRLWVPTLRCVRCHRVRLRDAARAWFFQPVTLDGGPIYFECRRCRPPEVRQYGRRGPAGRNG